VGLTWDGSCIRAFLLRDALDATPLEVPGPLVGTLFSLSYFVMPDALRTRGRLEIFKAWVLFAFTRFFRIDWESSKLRFILGPFNTKHFQSSSVNKGKGGPRESQIDICVCISRSVG
jgi:hypothetical protein